MAAQPLFGYLFLARDDLWQGMTQHFRTGNTEIWEEVSSEEVQVGRPVLIAVSEPGHPHLAGTGAIVDAPLRAPPVEATKAWVRYNQVFPSDLFRLPPPDTGARPAYGTWDNGQIDLIFGIRTAIPGQQAVPIRVPARTKISVSEGDAERIRRLFPQLEWHA
jgi:hypothetical protein